MASIPSKKQAETRDDYRQRYLDLLDEWDRAQATSGERVGEVAALLARLARAVDAAGDAALAGRIQGLCEALRTQPLDPKLSGRLRATREEVLGFMDAREHEAVALVRGLIQASDRLGALATSWRLRGAIKRFRKQLERDGMRSPECVHELLELQARTLAGLGAAPGGDAAGADEIVDEAQTPPAGESPPHGEPASEAAQPQRGHQHLQEHEGGALAPLAPLDWDAIRAVLTGMLDALEVPSSARGEAEALQTLLAGALDETLLLHVLERLGALTNSALLALRGDFSGFLDGVERRLDELLGALAGVSETEHAGRAQRRALTGQMRDHLSTLRSQARQAGDLNGLKSSIENHLEQLMDTLTGLGEQDERDPAGMQAQLEAMRGRLRLLENESAEARRQLQTQRRLALTDPLTGIANRLGFEEQAQQAVSAAAANASPLSLAMVDIDHFKKVNDSHGHPAGDRALCMVANILRSRVRATDVCARFGGEEFVVLFCGADAIVAARVMDQVRVFLSECGCNHQGQHIPLTASFGVTQIQDGESLEQAVERADQALYCAKNGGRNRVVTR